MTRMREEAPFLYVSLEEVADELLESLGVLLSHVRVEEGSLRRPARGIADLARRTANLRRPQEETARETRFERGRGRG